MSRLTASASRTFDLPAASLWKVVGDTDLWDRGVGLAHAQYTFEERDGKRVRVARAKEVGGLVSLEWIEPPYEWVQNQFVRGSRSFVTGPLERGGIEVTLNELGPSRTEVTVEFFLVASGLKGQVVARALQQKVKSALPNVFDAITNALASSLLDERLFAHSSPTNEDELARRAKRLIDARPDDLWAKRLASAIQTRSDDELAQIRPFAFADRLEAPRREVLATFLHATRAGLLELRWQINCPACRVSARVDESLADVRPELHCAACNIDYAVDFGDHVEAVFRVHPAIREVYPQTFCASSPVFLPHVFAQVRVGVEPVAIPSASADRPLRARLMGENANVATRLDGPAALHVTSRGISRTEADATHLRADHDVLVQVEELGFAAPSALGSTIATFPEFLDLFATEAPASGVELSVSHLAILFSDLTGSTAKYEEVGDARAFALVQRHFDAMSAAVRAHGGAVVKTMGDAVMATFTSEADATRAALEMIRAQHQLFPDGELGVKLGVYAGPVLAVRANDRLDFFGTTVNVAARLQGQAKSSELVVTRALADELFTTMPEDLTRREFDASLRGIKSRAALSALLVRM